MSSAEPMDVERRASLYNRRHGLWVAWTPRQARRYWHKELRNVGDYEPVDADTPAAERPKGRPTPRQRKPSRG